MNSLHNGKSIVTGKVFSFIRYSINAVVTCEIYKIISALVDVGLK